MEFLSRQAVWLPRWVIFVSPCGIHFAGRHISNIIPEGDGHVPCGGCRLAQMHRDVLGDDDPAQHPGHAVLYGVRAAAAVAGEQ